MELKEGPMTLKELSLWFGLKPDTLRNSKPEAKARKFKKLENFCRFHFEGKKLIIDQVYIAEYSKAYNIIEENFDKEWGLVIDPETRQANWQKTQRIDTCARVGKAIHYKYPEVKQVKESTAIAYVDAVKRENYGRTYKEEIGNKGYYQTVYFNKDRTALLSEEQMKIMKECRAEAYQEISEQRFKIDEARAAGEITLTQWKEALGEVDFNEAYGNYQELMNERLGFIPRLGTQLIDKGS